MECGLPASLAFISLHELYTYSTCHSFDMDRRFSSIIVAPLILTSSTLIRILYCPLLVCMSMYAPKITVLGADVISVRTDGLTHILGLY